MNATETIKARLIHRMYRGLPDVVGYGLDVIGRPNHVISGTFVGRTKAEASKNLAEWNRDRAAKGFPTIEII